MDNNGSSLVADWFRDKVVFVTGSTGFMGKVLVEKLLRDCPQIRKCYALMRAKRGIGTEQRRDSYVNHMIFDRIRATNPLQLNKIVAINGDISMDNLDICESDRMRLINETNVIFHCAANVRFDQKLADALNTNTLGTQRILELALEMSHLKVFSFVSTAFCQCNKEILEERAYAAPHDPLAIATMTKYLDNELLECITPKLLNGLPNTYIYAKALTEDLVNSYSGQIPIVITRPSTVMSAWKEPFPGWVEGMIGPTGLLIGAGHGIVRSMHYNPDSPANIIPVDICINAIIVSTWERGLANESQTVEVRNITLTHDKLVTWGQLIEMFRDSHHRTPICNSLWYPGGSMKSNYWHHLFCVIFYHYLPAYLVDGLMVVMRKKPFLIGIQHRISQGLKVLQYFTTGKWTFKNDKFLNMKNKLTPKDLKMFYMNTEEIDWHSYIYHYLLGVRQFLLKQKPETLPKARIHMRRLYLLDKLVSMLFYAFILWLIYFYWFNL